MIAGRTVRRETPIWGITQSIKLHVVSDPAVLHQRDYLPTFTGIGTGFPDSKKSGNGTVPVNSQSIPLAWR